MAGQEPVGSSTSDAAAPTAAGTGARAGGAAAPEQEQQHGLSSQQSGGGRSDQHRNPLKTPLLNKVQARSRRVTREESKTKHTWVYIMTFFAVMGNIALGYGLGYTSPVQEAMMAELNLSTSQFSTFGSLLSVGAMTGAIISGVTADFFGRRGGLILCCLPSIGGYLLIAFGHSTIPLYIGRFAVGLAGGVVCYIVPVLVAEAGPRHLRGFLSTMQQLSLSVGIMLSYLFGLFLSWRLLAAAGISFSIVCLIGQIFLPESPYWLAKLERAEALESSLQQLRGSEYNVSRELSDFQAAAQSAKHEPASKITDLLQRRYARPLLAGCGVHMLQQITGINGVMLYSGTIFLAAGIASAKKAALSIAVLQVIMTVVSAGLVDKAGRRLLLLLSASGMALSLFFVGLSFYLRGIMNVEFTSAGMDIFIDILALSSLLVYDASFSLGMGPIPWVLIGEIFPNSVKANAGSLASLTNWSFSWVIAMTFNFILQWSTSGCFWLFGFISLLAVVFVALFVPETKGKTLEQIEQSFK